MKIVSKVKDFFAPPKEVICKNRYDYVGCSPKKYGAVCFSRDGRVKSVNDISDCSEVARKFDLIPPIQKQVIRDYSRIGKITVVGITTGATVLVPQLKPFTPVIDLL